MTWKTIDDAPRDHRVVEVREDDFPPYKVRYWSKVKLAEDEWGDVEHGWYQYFPEFDEDGDELCNPTSWFDPTDN